MSSSHEERAAMRRKSWPGQVFSSGQAGHEPAQLPTAEERVSTMWTLALLAWDAAGRELPRYTRATMPGRVIDPE